MDRPGREIPTNRKALLLFRNVASTKQVLTITRVFQLNHLIQPELLIYLLFLIYEGIIKLWRGNGFSPMKSWRDKKKSRNHFACSSIHKPLHSGLCSSCGYSAEASPHNLTKPDHEQTRKVRKGFPGVNS